MSKWVLAVLFVVGCVDSPTAPPADEVPDPVQWPGYCVAENELDGMEGPDGRRTAFYEDDLLIRDEFDSDIDGDADVISSYEYDEDRQLIRLVIDEFADASPDEIRTYEWSDHGRMTRETWDQNADGEVDVDITYEHDEAGRRTRGEGQADEDPEAEVVLRFEWEGDLLVALYIDGFSAPADGRFERTIFYAYDEVGNVTTAVFDFDGNGVADMVVTYTYDCWM